jgi:REP element-mobilizing transposase RayT
MGRKKIPNAPNIVFHVTQRGNNRNDIFSSSHDKTLLLQIIRKYSKQFEIIILYYAIMNNHYHLLLKTGNIPLGKFMRKINVTYSRYYNYTHQRTGTLYEGRYRWVVVTSWFHFKRVLHYIAHNPVKAGLATMVGEYPWTGHHELTSSGIIIRILDRNELLQSLGPNLPESFRIYLEIIDSEPLVAYDFDGSLLHDEAGNSQDIVISLSYEKFCIEQNISIPIQILMRSGKCPQKYMKVRNQFIFSLQKIGVSNDRIGRFLSIPHHSVPELIYRTWHL